MWKWSDLKRILRKESRDVDVSDLAAIMWPVVYPTASNPEHRPKEPHITIVFLGEIEKLDYTKEDVVDAIKETLWDLYVWVKVIGLEWFGPEKNVPVLRVDHPYLYVFNEAMKMVLEMKGIEFDNTYPEYKPHVTITDEAALDGVWPEMLLAGPVELWWGGEHITIDEKMIGQVVTLEEDNG